MKASQENETRSNDKTSIKTRFETVGDQVNDFDTGGQKYWHHQGIGYLMALENRIQTVEYFLLRRSEFLNTGLPIHELNQKIGLPFLLGNKPMDLLSEQNIFFGNFCFFILRGKCKKVIFICIFPK